MDATEEEMHVAFRLKDALPAGSSPHIAMLIKGFAREAGWNVTSTQCTKRHIAFTASKAVSSVLKNRSVNPVGSKRSPKP